MKLTFRLVALVSVLASAYAGSSLLTACSGGGGTTDGGADAAKEGGTKDAGIKDTGGGGDADDAGPAPFIDPLCTAPNTPSNGSCVADAGFGCDPFSNSPCKTDAGEACDFGGNDFQCYPATPAPNTAALCATCDDQTIACLPGSTCVNADSQGSMKCAKFCCNDNDCTGGHCDNTTLSGGQQTPFGFCTK